MELLGRIKHEISQTVAPDGRIKRNISVGLERADKFLYRRFKLLTGGLGLIGHDAVLAELAFRHNKMHVSTPNGILRHHHDEKIGNGSRAKPARIIVKQIRRAKHDCFADFSGSPDCNVCSDEVGKAKTNELSGVVFTTSRPQGDIAGNRIRMLEQLQSKCLDVGTCSNDRENSSLQMVSEHVHRQIGADELDAAAPAVDLVAHDVDVALEQLSLVQQIATDDHPVGHSVNLGKIFMKVFTRGRYRKSRQVNRFGVQKTHMPIGVLQILSKAHQIDGTSLSLLWGHDKSLSNVRISVVEISTVVEFRHDAKIHRIPKLERYVLPTQFCMA